MRVVCDVPYPPSETVYDVEGDRPGADVALLAFVALP